jgi:hypothetical protein
VVLLFGGCGAVEVGLVPTPTPTPSLLRHENHDYGFAFAYPSDWTVEDEAHAVRLLKGALELRIAYKRVDEAAPLPPPPQAATDGTVYVDKLTFLGQMVPAEGAMYNRRMKAVVYQVPQPQSSADLEFSILLQDLSGDESTEAYDLVDIPDTAVAEVKTILESFERIPAEAGAEAASSPSPIQPQPTPMEDPYAGWGRYVNAEYGFAFRTPPNWYLVQVSGGQETPFGPSADAVQLRRWGLLLDIQFQHIGDDRFLGTTDLPAGDVVERDTVTFLGEPVVKHTLVFEGLDTAVLLRYSGDELDFYIELRDDPDSGRSHDEVPPSEAVEAEMDRVLSSFELVSGP